MIARVVAYLFLSAGITVGLWATYENRVNLQHKVTSDAQIAHQRDIQLRLALFTNCRSEGRTSTQCQKIAQGVILEPLTPAQEKQIIKIIGKPKTETINNIVKEIGKRGMRGEKGFSGERGLRGLAGKNGTNGKNGKSVRGKRGLKGAQGPRGSPGNTGAQGPQGAAGPPGPPGLATSWCPYTLKEVRVVGTGGTLGTTANIIILACVKN